MRLKRVRDELQHPRADVAHTLIRYCNYTLLKHHVREPATGQQKQNAEGRHPAMGMRRAQELELSLLL